jgi:uncharacterized phiE125 gp8 family phage protein
MALKLITPPAVEPILLADAKAHCRVDGTAEDTLITLYIGAARRAAENRTGLALIAQTWELALDAFPFAEIWLPLPPVASITSIKYLDANGVEQTLDAADYALDNYGSVRHWVIPAAGVEWPDTLDAANAVKVRFVTGYGASGSNVPEDIRAWMLLAIGTMYSQRETVAQGQVAELPGGFWHDLLNPYRILTF